MHVVASSAEGPGGRIAYLVWEEPGGDALLVDWDGPLPGLVEVVAREGLRPVWHARTQAQEPPAADAAALAALYPGLRTAWYAGCGTLRAGRLRVDAVWTPRDGGAAGLSFVVGERAAFVGDLPGAAAAGDRRAARSLETVRELAPAAQLHPGAV